MSVIVHEEYTREMAKNFVLENVFLMVSAVKEFIFKNRNDEVVGNLFSEKIIYDLLKSHNFFKIGKKR